MTSINPFRFNNEEPIEKPFQKGIPEDHSQKQSINNGKDPLLFSTNSEDYNFEVESLNLSPLKQGSIPQANLELGGINATNTVQNMGNEIHGIEHQPKTLGNSSSVPGKELNTAEANQSQSVVLSNDQLKLIATKKATCPFIGSAIASGALPVRNSADSPLANISDVVALGNSGGGNLGNLLKLFANGNHSKMQGSSGELDVPLSNNLFSLDFPGSQGSHPGHSGILQENPSRLDTGRFSTSDFERLAVRAKNGYLKRSDIAHFIAENLRRDPDSKVFSGKVAGLLSTDLGNFVTKTGPSILRKATHRQDDTADWEVLEALTKSLGENNLVGSAGEFGLMMAFLANSPNTKRIEGEPALSLSEVTMMFRDHQFPDGWEKWPKTEKDWVINTTALMIEAGKDYLHH